MTTLSQVTSLFSLPPTFTASACVHKTSCHASCRPQYAYHPAFAALAMCVWCEPDGVARQDNEARANMSTEALTRCPSSETSATGRSSKKPPRLLRSMGKRIRPDHRRPFLGHRRRHRDRDDPMTTQGSTTDDVAESIVSETVSFNAFYAGRSSPGALLHHPCRRPWSVQRWNLRRCSTRRRDTWTLDLPTSAGRFVTSRLREGNDITLCCSGMRNLLCPSPGVAWPSSIQPSSSNRSSLE